MKIKYIKLVYCVCVSLLMGCADHVQKSTNESSTDFRIIFDSKIVGHIRETKQISPHSIKNTRTMVLPTQFRGLKKINNRIEDIQEEDSLGHPLLFSHKVEIPGADWSLIGKIENRNLILQERHGDTLNESQLPIPENLIFSEELHRRLALSLDQNIPVLYDEFDRETFSFVQVSARALINRQPEGSRKLIKEMQNYTTEFFVDDKFIPLHYSIRFLGKSLMVERCNTPCFLEKFVALKPLDYQLLPSPYRITDSALRGHIRYRIVSPSQIPASYSQKVLKLDANTWQIDVCETCNIPTKFEDKSVDEFLKVTPWLEVNNEHLLNFIANKTDYSDSPAIKMKKLAKAVKLRLEKNPQFSGYGTALQAFNSHTGDCTEYAVLLAALGRAAKIPTRVVFGLSYSREEFHGKRDQFVPHAWVEALIENHWISFDAAFENFDAGHIALKISDGNPNDFQQMIEVLNETQILSANQIVQKILN